MIKWQETLQEQRALMSSKDVESLIKEHFAACIAYAENPEDEDIQRAYALFEEKIIRSIVHSMNKMRIVHRQKGCRH